MVPAPAPVEAELTKLANRSGRFPKRYTTENVASDIERIRSFYDPLIERLYENADPRKRDLEQLQPTSSAYSSRQAFLSELTLDPPQATGNLQDHPQRMMTGSQ